MEKKDSNNKKKIIISMLIVLISIIIAIVLITVILPKNYINSINNEYELQHYERVANYNRKLNIIHSYLKDNEEEYNKIQYKIKFSTAINLFEKKEYKEALTELEDIISKDTEIENKINECKFELGKKYIEEEKYEEAIEALQELPNKEEIDSVIDDAYCKLALKILDKNDYKKSLEVIEKARNMKSENVTNTRKKIHYQYGKYYLSIKDYNSGIAELEKAKDFEDANTLVINAYIENAEKYIKEDNLKEAKEIYDYLPADVSYKDIKVSVRKEQLNRFANLIEATGKKLATESYCESKNVWKYDGRWTNWYIDTPDSSEYITTKISLNDDGTISLKETVYFYAYNNFSNLKDHCKAQIISRTIKIEHINEIPSSYNIDENTELRYFKGTFSIKYSKKDDYSTNFYNMYNSTVKY